MQKRHIYISIFSLITAFVSCSKLDQYTDRGSEILETIDPMLINFEKNFYSFTADSQIVTESFSLPGAGLSGFGHHSGTLAAGFIDGISVYGYTSFSISSSFTEKFDTADIVDSIVFVYEAGSDSIDSVVSADPALRLRLFSCTEDDKYFMAQPAEDENAAGILGKKSEDDRFFTATLLDSTLVDSIFRSCLINRKCLADKGNNNAGKQYCDSLFSARFIFALFSNGSTLAGFKTSPIMVIHSHRTRLINGKDSSTTRADSLRGVSGIVAHETDSIITVLSTQPVCAGLSQRTAVFKIDMSELWEVMDSSGFDELLSAAMVFERRRQTVEDNDSTAALFYFVSDRVFSEVNTLDMQIDTMNRYYSPFVKLKSDGADTIVLPIDYHLQHLVRSRVRYIYLYLRLKFKGNLYGKKEILWGKPRFKAVLTTIKR